MGFKTIDEANEAVVQRMISTQPTLIDVVPAKSVISELNDENTKTLLHAGPPIRYDQMSDPMQGSCVGAVLFEKWADNEEDARKMLENDEIRFVPFHHVNGVGPMGGITSANFPVLVVKDTTNENENNEAYCTLNEGIGAVLRFGAFGPTVIERLEWQRDVLGPVLSKALKTIEGGMNVNGAIARAIAMGDEFHQRNIAASYAFLRDLAPIITALDDVEQKDKEDVIQFLADTDQFFLNVAMAAGKAMTDTARKEIQSGTIVTAMCRNGHEFGIRIAGMGDEWFTGPVNTPQGLYFTGFSEEDANPDMGDSAITETMGVGGMAMIAAPAVTRFVGTGGFNDALETSNDMAEITVAENPNWIIPTWNFKGAPTGIDARLVVETGILPVINTGIANKVAGRGQIGAGTVTPPMEAFEKAITAYAEKLGMK